MFTLMGRSDPATDLTVQFAFCQVADGFNPNRFLLSGVSVDFHGRYGRSPSQDRAVR
jgi:hypothetical protein